MAAAESDSIRCTKDPVSYKIWHIKTPQGDVNIWDDGNGCRSICEVNLKPEAAEGFWQRLQEKVDSSTG